MNTKTNYTPGPWETVNIHYNPEILTNDGKIRIATVAVSGHGTTEEHQANARLIAAAPELLEALKITRGQWIDSVNAKQCLAAIAKAEGGIQC